MSRAKALIEAMCPAPTIEPKTKPATAPGRQAPPAPRKPSTNPFRRRDIRPGEEPRPKAMMRAPATESKEDDLHARVKEKYLNNRVHGYTRGDATKVAPVSREAAEQMWAEKEHEFRAQYKDPELRKNFGLDEGNFRSSEKPSLPGKAKKLIAGKSSGTGASGLTAKKAFKK